MNKRLGDHYIIENTAIDDIVFGLLGKMLGTYEDHGQDIIILSDTTIIDVDGKIITKRDWQTHKSLLPCNLTL